MVVCIARPKGLAGSTSPLKVVVNANGVRLSWGKWFRGGEIDYERSYSVLDDS